MIVEVENIRIDKYLSDNTKYSRTTINHMLDEDYILVNNKHVKPSYLLKNGDVISIKEGYIKELSVEPEKMPLDIVYEDNDIMVINKPSGLVVHPGSGNYSHTLVNALMYYTQNLSHNNGEIRPGIVHRIDKDTSGLILIAKTNESHEILAEEFKNHTIKREYLALLTGVFPHNSATIDAPIGRDTTDRKKMCVTSTNSKKAITNLTVLKRYHDYTLVKLKLETGRTHQIRVHMKYIGYPIYNDPIYTNKKATKFGQFLHSYTMSFKHPITKKDMYFEAPLPEEFQKFLDKLDQENL